jgi:HSP20 family molecular chaperone IbpA
MKNKNIILSIGFILLLVIAYQAYLLYQVNHPISNEKIKEIKMKNDEPQVTLNIGKTSSKNTRSISTLTQEQQIELDQKRIENSIQDLFKSIFASKEVQDGLTQFKAQAQMGLQELQKELQNLPKELDKLSLEMKDDPILSQLFQSLKGIKGGVFEDRGDYYFTKITLVDGKNSKVDISTDEHFLTILITNKKNQIKKMNNSTISQSSSSSSKNIIALPNDALVEKLQTKYENGILEITIPKIKASTKS